LCTRKKVLVAKAGAYQLALTTQAGGSRLLAIVVALFLNRQFWKLMEDDLEEGLHNFATLGF
jgi:hypothetical protein